jgi:hypothetical protein
MKGCLTYGMPSQLVIEVKSCGAVATAARAWGADERQAPLAHRPAHAPIIADGRNALPGSMAAR